MSKNIHTYKKADFAPAFLNSLLVFVVVSAVVFFHSTWENFVF